MSWPIFDNADLAKSSDNQNDNGSSASGSAVQVVTDNNNNNANSNSKQNERAVSGCPHCGGTVKKNVRLVDATSSLGRA